MTWPPRTTTLVLAVGVLLTGACGDDGNPDTLETGADVGTGTTVAGTGADGGTTAATAGTAATVMAEDTACTDEPQLHIVNDTGNTLAEILVSACEMGDDITLTLPPGGLPDGGELTVDLPIPGCWMLQYSGEGCFADPPGMVEAVACETTELTLGGDNHVCAGG